MNADVAASAHFPGGHIEGWPDAFKNMMQQFYQAVQAGKMPATAERRFASFSDGADVMYIIDAIIKAISSSAGYQCSAKHAPGSPGSDFMVAST